MNVIHAGLIPRGPNQGKVVFLSWDVPPGVASPTTWGILDAEEQQADSPPTAAAFVHVGTNATPTNNWTKMTCVGQSWTPDGRWFIAGGQVPPPGLPPASHNDALSGQGFGADGAWIYDPDVVGFGGPAEGAWFAQPAMQKVRYYPTVMLTQIDSLVAPNGELIVAGGSYDWWNGTGTPSPVWQDDYEAFRPGPRLWPNPLPGTWQTMPGGSRLFPGPTIPAPATPWALPIFKWYPRLFLLPDGRMVCAGTEPQTSIALHPTSTAASWTNLRLRTPVSWPYAHGYGAALLHPNFTATLASTVVNIGGSANGPVADVEWANAASTAAGPWPNGHGWTTTPPNALPPLANAREECNAVILPNGEIMVLGDGSPAAVRTPELLRGSWKLLPDEDSVRDHHAIALLLPSGKVLSMAGNNRWYDFQVYEPWYVTMPRPAWVTTPGNGALLRGTTLTETITLPAGSGIGKVVLMRPGSLTHHGDMDQRYVQLNILPNSTPNTVTFETPVGPPAPGGAPGQVRVPLGYYMIFIVTDSGVPSEARFVRFQ